jgi:hypothetical protein
LDNLLFDAEPDETTGVKLDVAHAEFVEGLRLSWQELFDGYDTLHAVTYSSDIGFMTKLIEKFNEAEIIFGFPEVLSYTLQEIIAYQIKTIERVKDTAKNKNALLRRIDNQTLRLLVAREQISHEKLYLLKSGDKRRVIIGSANMSAAAFSGRQREKICYMDGAAAYNWYYDSFEDLKEHSSDEITKKALMVDGDVQNIDTLPIAETVVVKKALLIEPQQVHEETRFVMDVRSLAGKIASSMPKTGKQGNILLMPEHIKQTTRRIESARAQEKDWRAEFPQLIIDVETQNVSLNGREFDLRPSTEDVARDTRLFLEYMNGYEKLHGETRLLQKRYFEFAVWFFASPFMAQMRHVALICNQQLFPYPVFGLLYGQSKAGKTSFLETLLKMMIGQKTKINAAEFTRSSIDRLKRAVSGVPIIVDDLTSNRFSEHAIETIKNDEFGRAENLTHYPAVVISANEDIKAVAQEITRRTIICRVRAGLKNTEIMKNNLVARVQKQIGTAFFREYTRRMLEKIPDMMNQLKSDDDAGSPDVLSVSSEMMCAIITEHSGSALPFFARRLSLEDYFGEKVTGEYTIKTISAAWKVNKKSFEMNKKLNELRYNAGQTWEADRLLKELPEDLEAARAREWVIMNLNKAKDFFGINFKRGLF